VPLLESLESEKLKDVYRLLNIEHDSEAINDIKMHVEKDIIPRYVRNSFMIALWACFELSIEKIIEKICQIASYWSIPSIPLNKLYGSFLEKVKTFFKYGDQDTFRTDYFDEEFLRCIVFIRNNIAHGNSRSDDFNEKQQKDFKRYVEKYEGLEERNGFILVNEHFCQAAYDSITKIIASIFSDLIEYASDAQR
jgi:hypothetical protein